MKNLLLLVVPLLLSIGCAANRAQHNLERGVAANKEIKQAFFVKAWTLNRALFTEARQKWIGKAAERILSDANANGGKVDVKVAMEVIATLNQEIGQDEAVITESFAYLAYLLISGERADGFFGNVDNYLQSKKPLWKHLQKSPEDVESNAANDVARWKPLIKDIEKMMPGRPPQGSQ
jgi:hypothetical protein